MSLFFSRFDEAFCLVDSLLTQDYDSRPPLLALTTEFEVFGRSKLRVSDVGVV